MKKSSLACLLLSCLGLSALAETPKGLSDSDWSSIRSVYEAGRHEFHRRDDGSHAAENPGQGWAMEFDGRGFTARPESGDWSWGLELENAEVGPMTAQGNRLTVARGEHLEEWFINDSRGLEQGWTLKERPADAGETLRLSLKVRGGLAPVASEGSVSFGGGVLSYGGLKAWDATGRVLKARFLPDGEKVVIEVEDDAARYPITIDPVAQEAYLKASNTGADDGFSVVAISGDTVVVGAPDEGSGATTINGNESDDSLYQAGAAYVFVRIDGVWSQQAYLKAFNAGAQDEFGVSVAIDGDTIVVGAFNESSSATGVNGDGFNNGALSSGAAYIFTRTDDTWSHQAYLKGANTEEGDQFGTSVAISGDTVVVGAPYESSSQTSVTNGPGGSADNSALRSGAAYVFQRSVDSWTQQAYLKASNTEFGDSFGNSVAISGDIVVIGAYEEDGESTGINGDEEADGAMDSGAAYVFSRSSGIWSQEAYLKASNTGEADGFGFRVAISGNTAVVGAPAEDSAATGVNGNGASDNSTNSGAAYVFHRGGIGWTEQAYLKAPNTGAGDSFSISVAISGDVVVVGALGEASSATGIDGDGTNNDAVLSGAAYVYLRNGEAWSEAGYLKASNTGANDWFGAFVAVSGDTLVVGAPAESSAETGVTGSGDNNDASRSGAVYVFPVPEIRPVTPANLNLSGPVRFQNTKRKKRSRPQTVTVRNAGGSPATSLSASTSLSDFLISPISPAPLAAGASRTMDVTFAPKRKGERSATLTVNSSAPAVSTSLSGKGLDSGSRRKR